ncbi:type VII secretion protein EccCb [Saccharopolyspora sp. K220]|uniref:type VII secretion protein EccCb n=1 Tax=Saccharopolyspora soli TaxID=2926618 RepID=UPI001F560324|nr:type VII secretion protein EccCb [Saccharopolyspora soli]MCI2421600.1 type VII secretion protein EccCb [Saccharopolyspora soli]
MAPPYPVRPPGPAQGRPPVPPPPVAPRPPAPVSPSADTTQIVRPTPSPDEPINLFNLVGFGDPAHCDLDQAWQQRSIDNRYRIAIGVDDHGNPVHLDLKKSGHGVGIFGSAGSGKSELLRTILFGLAATHSSTAVNFICLSRAHHDQVWRSLHQIPHTALAEPVLSNDLTGSRLDDALIGALSWQAEQFNRAEVTNFADYQRIQPESDFEPMPMLLVAIDDLPGVLHDRPEFATTIDQLTRARNSGIKVVYTANTAAQISELAGGIATRIALRTTESESVKLIGQPWARDLPDSPGHGYLAQLLQDSPIRFRAARTDLPQGTPQRENHPTIPQVFADRIRGQAPPARQLVLPLPGEPPAGIDVSLSAPEVTGQRGFNAEGEPLKVPIGMLDNPFQHRHDPLQVDFAGPDGNMTIVGRPRSGKTTAVQTTLLALALTHTPAEVRFYCLDFGGGGLAPLRDLPHTRIVTGSPDPDYVALAIRELEELLLRREKSFGQHGIDSIAEFRQRRAGEDLDEVATDHFLVIDGWPEVHQHPGIADRVLRLARRGLAYGIHLVVTANRWDDLPRELRELIGGRIELRLADPRDSLISTERAEAVADDKPGRGVHAGRHCAINLPVLGEKLPDYLDFLESGLPDDLADGTRELVARISESWTGDRLPELRRPPEFVSYDELPEAEPNAIPIGIDSHGEPVVLDLNSDHHRHLLIVGGRESGKSTVIRNALRGISAAYPAKEAMAMVVDYRREHHHALLPDSHTLSYVRSPEDTRRDLKDFVAALRKRLPGADGKPTSWTGPKVFLVVDDFDLLLSTDLKMLSGLDELLPHDDKIDLHLVLAYNADLERNRNNIVPTFKSSAYQLILKDAPGFENGVGVRGERPRDAGEAHLWRNRGGRADLRIAWLPHPLES